MTYTHWKEGVGLVRVPEITERDATLIEELYSLGGMNMRQIWRTHFSETSYKYAQRRTGILKNRGLIVNEGHLWRATSRGLSEINVEIKTRPEYIVQEHGRRYLIKLSEIHAVLKDSAWQWLPSRLAKEQFKLDRMARLGGILHNTVTGEYYSVYLLSKNPYNETILRTQSEIQRFSSEAGLSNVIIFAESAEAMKRFGNNHCRTIHLHLLPYPYGINLLKKTALPEWLDAVVVEQFSPSRVMLTRELHADKVIEVGGKEYYLTELVTNDLVKKYHLERYGQDQAERDRPVKILCLKGQLSKFKEDFSPAAYPHIEFVSVQL